MGYLKKGAGLFALNDSDRYCGSFITKEDVSALYGIDDITLLNKLPFKDGIIDELELFKATNKKLLSQQGINPDPIILEALIRKLYPDAHIQRNVICNRLTINLFVKTSHKEFYLDFLSPYCFDSWRGKMPNDPRIRKQRVENASGVPCYLWPYWVQRCMGNMRILLENENKDGWGALWTSKHYFGLFPFDNSATIIEELSEPFHLAHNGDYGYILEKWDSEDKQKPEHPIIREILSRKYDRRILIPNGSRNDTMWLPSILKK